MALNFADHAKTFIGTGFVGSNQIIGEWIEKK
jgi:hypothetical protein